MDMKVKDVAEMVGVSIRTLHHYDQIGLLTPNETTDSGYRLYSEEDLDKLQQILFFKELDFPLKEIKRIIHSSSFNKKETLILQRKMLIAKRNRINTMIETIDKTIKHIVGEIQMTHEERFVGINFSHKEYEKEARERWGNQSVNKVNTALEKMTKDEHKGLAEKWDSIFNKLSLLRDQSPKSIEVQLAIKDWYEFLNEHFGKYSTNAFYGLSQLYINDERFSKNIDQYGNGLTRFMSEAMKVFSENH